MSIYRLKPAFQNLLRPLVKRLHKIGITANQVTVLTCFLSVALGLGLYFSAPAQEAFALIPFWMLIRMALNAVDGMLAREFGQMTPLGAFLNELTDVVSDAALYLPFAWVVPESLFWLGVVIVLAGLSEFAGALGATVGASRRYDGPMGKSDRAFVFGAFGLVWALDMPLPMGIDWLMPVLAGLIALTVVRRVRAALQERV